MKLNSNLTVRKFELNDKAILYDLIFRTKNFNQKDRDVAVDLIETYITHRYDGSYIECLLKEGKVIGFIYYEEAPLCEGVIEIYYVAVDPDETGKGYGTYLFNDLEERQRKKGVRIILLETSSTEEYFLTKRFYEKIGYIQIGKVKDYYKKGDDKITYEKRFDIDQAGEFG